MQGLAISRNDCRYHRRATKKKRRVWSNLTFITQVVKLRFVSYQTFESLETLEIILKSISEPIIILVRIWLKIRKN